MVVVARDEGGLGEMGGVVRARWSRATRCSVLAQWREAVKRDYLTLDALQQGVRAATSKLESGFVGRFARFHGE